MNARSWRRAFDAGLGSLAVCLLKAVRRLPRRQAADFAAWCMRTIGPRLKEQQVGRANLTAAFPEKSAGEIDAILEGVWDNLGRVGVEFAHIDRLRIMLADTLGKAVDASRPEDIFYDEVSYERLQRLRFDERPALLFTAHLANWEVPAYTATAAHVPLTVLYRRLENAAVNDAVLATRSGLMGRLVSTDRFAPAKLVQALETGRHVAMLVDQHLGQGVNVTFFGRTCIANPLIAWLAQHVDCPIHGARAIRLPDRNRFRVEITEAIEPARDASGRIELQGTTQRINEVIEGWVREHPEQWLWLHRRWRGRWE
jgi:KDO2-lipid IV(A) lauroyltransferase